MYETDQYSFVIVRNPGCHVCLQSSTFVSKISHVNQSQGEE